MRREGVARANKRCELMEAEACAAVGRAKICWMTPPYTVLLVIHRCCLY